MGEGQQSDFREAIPDNDHFRISDIPTTLFSDNSAIICPRKKMKTYLNSAGNSASSSALNSIMSRTSTRHMIEKKNLSLLPTSKKLTFLILPRKKWLLSLETQISAHF